MVEGERETGWGRGGSLFEAGHLSTFSAFRMGAYSIEVGANSRRGAYSNKYGIWKRTSIKRNLIIANTLCYSLSPLLYQGSTV